MTQKEKLAKRLEDVEEEVFSLEIHTNPEGDGIVLKTVVDYTIIRYAKLYLPNRILAKIIKSAKAKRKELKEEQKRMIKEGEIYE